MVAKVQYRLTYERPNHTGNEKTAEAGVLLTGNKEPKQRSHEQETQPVNQNRDSEHRAPEKICALHADENWSEILAGELKTYDPVQVKK
jgi:hypothetical protein